MTISLGQTIITLVSSHPFYKMVNPSHISKAALLAASFLSILSAAHPEHHEMEEALARRDEHAAMIQRGLEKCASDPNFQALQERGLNRRWEKVKRHRQARDIDQAGTCSLSQKYRMQLKANMYASTHQVQGQARPCRSGSI